VADTTVRPVILKGGLNLASSVLELDAGECIQLFNYEVNTLGRYQRVLGYERFDGRPAPSAVLSTSLVGYPFANDAAEIAAVKAERDARRAAIGSVPGSGQIRGIFTFEGYTYAFRDNVGATQCNLYKSSASGWALVTTPVRLPGGNYEIIETNFTGSASSNKIYGVDGVNKLFQFDGTTLTEIAGEITPDAPTHLEALPSQILLLAYSGGTFLYSAVGDPTKFSPVDGGGEIGCADSIVGMSVQASNSCAIFCRNRTYMLYGTSSADFQLQILSKNTGAIEGSIQTISDAIYLDDRGLARLDRVQQFGNFDMATVSQKIEPLLRRYINNVTASFTIKEKNQYRLCFGDGSGIIATMYGQEVSGFSVFDLGKIVRCTWSAEDEQGKEVVYFGSDDGYVYELEKGFTFDGQPISFVCRPAFTNFRATDYKKRWKKIVLEADTVGEVNLSVTPDFDYSDPSIPYQGSTELLVMGGGGYWDEANWDESRWSSASTFTADMYIDGVSRNISIVISGTADEQPPHILNSYIVHYSARGRRR
jgi:hypothetical protein